jgi:radical SAM superfamily enzyme YgiQ (UPF0313 family)
VTRVLLVSTYDLGHQSFGLASPAAWLAADGAEVSCLDLAVQTLDEAVVRAADLVAFYLPMHTATRIAADLIPRVRLLNPRARLCAYGLYAPVNRDLLHELGVDAVIGGEFEEPLAALVRGDGEHDTVSLARQDFLVPSRQDLPTLDRYAHLTLPDGTTRTVGYTEATRGCKHLCRHCPIVPVYGGRFRVVQRDVVLADIRQQIAAGAQHITFGDPDFFNGPAHALALVRSIHEEFPELTYDVTIKVEHLVANLDRMSVLRDTGCIMITSAVESVDERILEIFDKQHSRADFLKVVNGLREVGIHLNPTFVAFTPWTSLEGYMAFLDEIDELDLVASVAPIQYAIRLLIPEGSKLLELADVQNLVEPFDRTRLCYPWRHPDPAVDALQEAVFALVAEATERRESRAAVFDAVRPLVAAQVGGPTVTNPRPIRTSRPVPQLSEPWYCCAEPTEDQRISPI